MSINKLRLFECLLTYFDFLNTYKSRYYGTVYRDVSSTLATSTNFYMPHLEFPNLSHKQSYLEMIEEWREAGEEIIPSRLFSEEPFETFIEIIYRDVTDSPTGVNAHLFFLVENGRILGSIQIRHHIDHPNLIETGGHIGYGIRPSERGK